MNAIGAGAAQAIPPKSRVQGWSSRRLAELSPDQAISASQTARRVASDPDRPTVVERSLISTPVGRRSRQEGLTGSRFPL